METINIRYLFKLPDNRQEIIDIHLHPETLDLMNAIPEKLPHWTKLDFHQCPNCLLTLETRQNCPIAAHFVTLLSIFESLLSYETIHYVYSNIKIINEAMARRLCAIYEKNVAVNSLVIE